MEEVNYYLSLYEMNCHNKFESWCTVYYSVKARRALES